MHRLCLFALVGCGSASARLELSNDTVGSSARHAGILADGTSLRLKLIATYLSEDVDPVSQDNTGKSSMIWVNPECNGDISNCNVAGVPGDGPRVTNYFDLSRPSTEVNAELDSQDAQIEPGTYRYARIEMCKFREGDLPSIPMLMWKGPGMAEERPFVSGDCGRTSLAFDPPLEIAVGDTITVRLGYDLANSIVTGAPTNGGGCPGIAGVDDENGHSHCFRECEDTEQGRTCMEYPDFAPTALRL